MVRRAERDGGGLGEGVLRGRKGGKAEGRTSPSAPQPDRRGLFEDAGLSRAEDGSLLMGQVPLATIAGSVGTPVYVYNVEAIRDRYLQLDTAFASVPHRIHFAAKANSTLAILRLFRDLGAGADIVSGGELARCLTAGFSPDRIVFSGVGKTDEELEAAVARDVGAIHVESLDELALLGAIAERLGTAVRVGIRVNPDVLTETHPFISTGQHGIKFGVPMDQVEEAVRRVTEHPKLRLTTLAMHLGSQLLDLEPYAAGVRRLVERVVELQKQGVETLSIVDIGGGLGIRYFDERPPEPDELAAVLVPLLLPTGLTVHLEPGRFLVGSAGILLTRVLYRKHSGGKGFLVVDCGMNDLVRPSRYGAYHDIVEVRPREGEGNEVLVDVVGPVCETGDFLALDRSLPPVERGDVLAVLGAGAYGFVMASSYNSRPRPPEVVVDGERWAVARRRESVEDLMEGEAVAPIVD